MQHNPDLIIIGAGIMGLCAALEISRRCALKICVLEQGAGPGEGSTGASSAVCRHRYSHDETVVLARDGIDRYRRWQDFLETDRTPLAQFQPIGALWLASQSTPWQASEVDRLAALGVPALLLSDADLEQRFPALNSCPIAPDTVTGAAHDCQAGGPHLFEASAGYMDPQNALTDLIDTLRARGVEIRFNTRVSGLISHNGAIGGVRTSTAESLHCPLVLNASGPWCNALLEEVGLHQRWPLRPTRIQIVHLDRPVELEGDLPVCVDLASGIYFRPQNRGQQIIVGSTREEDEREYVAEPSQLNRQVDDEFRIKVLHALHHRLPALPYRGHITGYCGLYTINCADMHPVVGRTPMTGFFVANGFSGHGFKLAPAIGSLLAQAITGIRLATDTEVSPDFLGWDRTPLQLAAMNVLA